MVYTAIDTFYLTDEQLQNSPSRRDGIDEATETTLRIYGCDLIQEACILLRLSQPVTATGQVLFHRFYCKQSFSRFNVKRVAASCVWLASKLEEDPRKGKHVIMVFHRMECRRENLPIQHLDIFSEKYTGLKTDLTETERRLLIEMGFVCHFTHPHKFISICLWILEAPPKLIQEAWNLANDSLRTTLCVQIRSEVIACGVIYAAARRVQVALPENRPWWERFNADISGINHVCRVLAHLYTLPKAQYVSVCKEGEWFTSSNTDSLSPAQPVGLQNGQAGSNYTTISKVALAKGNADSNGKEVKKSPDDRKYKTDHSTEASRKKNNKRWWEREMEKLKSQDRYKGRTPDRECERDSRKGKRFRLY